MMRRDIISIIIINEPGLRATATIPEDIPLDSQPIEIQINFCGTIDFASKYVDIERGGPGQETIAQYEGQLMKQVNHLTKQISFTYPNHQLNLKIAGHSLGGSLAKGFTHSLQRAIVVQKETPDKIVDEIKGNLVAQSNFIEEDIVELKDKLAKDAATFQNCFALKKINEITLYALGAPGISATTDKHASLLTYYHEPDFLRVYNHFHIDDINPKYGESEFLSGIHGVPRILVNKAIQYTTKITPEEIDAAQTLPFPGYTKLVSAAHNVDIYCSRKEVKSEVSESFQSKHLAEHFIFPKWKHLLYDTFFSIAKFLAQFKLISKLVPSLDSLPVCSVESPKVISAQNKAANVIQKKYKEHLSLRKEESTDPTESTTSSKKMK